jgi:hypothetical protein
VELISRFMRADRAFTLFPGYSEAERLTPTFPAISHPDDPLRTLIAEEVRAWCGRSARQ